MSLLYPKRLIEVDLPIKRISAHARREKSIRHEHISTLHIWWARRPLAACRAVICAALWPDPADPLCPDTFRTAAQKLMEKWANDHLTHCGEESGKHFVAIQKDPRLLKDNTVLRRALLDFIADFANWDNSTVRAYLDTSRALTHAAHEALGGASGTRPLVIDPFAGGGSIPLEALRVGADAFASDLNPIPVLLNKVVLEYIPKYGQRLADEVRKWGEWIKEEAEKELTEFYPKRRLLPEQLQKKPLLLINAKPSGFSYVTVTDAQDHLDNQGGDYTHYVLISMREAHEPSAMKAALSDWGSLRKFDSETRLKDLGAKPINFLEETPIAYLWARTVQCEGPGCGVEVPLIRALWLAQKGKRSLALQLVPNKKAKCVDFQIIIKQGGGWVDQAKPKTKIENPKFDGTVKRGSATCPCCGYTTPVTRTREQLKARHGGTNDARLMCVVTTRPNEKGRFYRLPSETDIRVIRKAAEELNNRKKAHDGPLSLVPNEKLDVRGIRHTWAMIYGLEQWGDYFMPRQALSLTSLVRRVETLPVKSDDGLRAAVQTCLALAVGKQADRDCSLCRWISQNENIGYTFGRQAIGIMWDFVEAPWLSSGGGWGGIIQDMTDTMVALSVVKNSGHAEQSSATTHPLPDDAAQAMITDPPYYDSVPYAHLSDFFYVWLRRVLWDVNPQMFRDSEVPKDQEIVVDRPHALSSSTHDIAFYERELAKAFSEGRRVVQPSGIGTIVFASKSTSSWEAILQAVISAGWTITGSWPIDTEREARIAAQGQARLGSSIHLICRPRENPDGSVRTDDVGDLRDVLQELPRRIHEWMPRLDEEGIVGADAIFACLGPALEIFSRYSRVEKASGEGVTLKEYLEHVWAAVAKEALSLVFQGADASGFEEDARLTAMWLWTLRTGESNGNGALSDEESEENEQEDEGSQKVKFTGFALEYDAARKIAQGLGAHLEDLTSLVEIKGDIARLLPVAERTRALFGKDEAQAPATAKRKKEAQLKLGFEAELKEVQESGGWGEKGFPRLGSTVLNRVHQSMILFAAARGEALRRLLVDEGVGRDERFWRLAQALSALYPSGTDERRWVEGVQARKKGLGL